MDQPAPVTVHFRFCPRCGAPRQDGGGNPFRCIACDFMLFGNPAVAVGAFVQDDHGRVLWVRRAKDPGKGLLGLPGGFIDANERLEEALVREVREETALAVTQWAFLASFPNTYAFQGCTYPVLDLFCTARVSGVAVADPDEVSAMLWLPPEEVTADAIAFPSVRAAWALWRSLPPATAAGGMRA